MNNKECSWGMFWRSDLGSLASHCYALLNTWEDGCHLPGDLPFSQECWKSTAERSGCPSSSLHRHRASSHHRAGTGSSWENKVGSRSWRWRSSSRGSRGKKSCLVLSENRNCRHNRMWSHRLTKNSWEEQTQTSCMIPVRSLKRKKLKPMDLISVFSRVEEKLNKKACREALKYY